MNLAWAWGVANSNTRLQNLSVCCLVPVAAHKEGHRTSQDDSLLSDNLPHHGFTTNWKAIWMGHSVYDGLDYLLSFDWIGRVRLFV